MPTTLAPTRAPSLAAYARNVTRSHCGWRVELCTRGNGASSPALVAGEPLRRLRVEGEDLVLEYGAPPGRARRCALTGPLEFAGHHSGRTLELHLRGPRNTEHVLLLSPD